MYLSFSGWKQYVTCPRAYWHRYLGKTILASPENRINSLYGSAVGKLFELFYNEHIWKRSGTIEILLGMVDPELDQLMKNEERSGMINWSDPKANYKSRDELVEAIREAVPRGIATIRYHKLIGLDAKAEVKLDTLVDGHMIGGRADFVMTRVAPHSDLVILDGKGSRHRETYVDERQLLWYAMLYRTRTHVTPDKLGFVYWRSEPAQSLDWVMITDKALDEMQETALADIRQIDEGAAKLATGDDDVRHLVMANVFQPQPGGKCRLCAYTSVCPEGQIYTSKSHQIPVYAGGGVEDVGLDV